MSQQKASAFARRAFLVTRSSQGGLGCLKRLTPLSSGGSLARSEENRVAGLGAGRVGRCHVERPHLPLPQDATRDQPPHAVMMYIRYPLSLRNFEDLLHERGIVIARETVRFWWNRFGTIVAAEIRRSKVQTMRAFRHRRWHLDEVFVKINGERHYLFGLSTTRAKRSEASSRSNGTRRLLRNSSGNR